MTMSIPTSRSGTQQDLKGAIATTNSGGAGKPGGTIKQLLDRMQGEFARAVPKHIDVDRLLRIALTTIRQNPQLMAADQQSLLAALMTSAQLGLEPGPLGHAYLIPFRNNRANRTDVQFIIGYTGYLDMARRSGQVLNIRARPVYENDMLDLEYGLDDKMVHVPWHRRTNPDGSQRFAEPGKLQGVTLVARFKDDGYITDFMPLYEIEQRRKRSKSPDGGPWVTDYEAMAMKTIVRKNWRWLPLSIEFQQAAASDETVKREIAEDMTEVPDAEFTVRDDDSATPESTTHEEVQDGTQGRRRPALSTGARGAELLAPQPARE